MQHLTKILVVDDEPDLADLIRITFRRQIRAKQLAFSYAGDGVEALEQLAEDPEIEIVLTDINMPRMDGLTLLDKLGEQQRPLKAVVVSAYGDLTNIRAAMNKGAFDFLIKPIELDDLQITLNKSKTTVEQLKRAAQVRQAFGRYVSDEVVTTLMENPEALQLGGEKRTITMLMSDLRGFSTLSERLPPEEVVEILNAYLGAMADVITRYQGLINEFIGDAIFVIFGAPVQQKDDAQRAIACALDMQLAMGAVNEEMEKRGLSPLQMGIGINTGEVVVGNIGSVRRMKYGAVGSHVNLTSRIESYTVGGQILVAENTLEAAGTTVQIGEQLRVSVKGFSEPVNVYAVDAIGKPYNLLLPAQVEHMTTLPTPMPFQFTFLDGKHMTGDLFDGEIVRLSAMGALVHTARPLTRLDNLQLMLPAPDRPAELLGDLYAKVIGEEETSGLMKLRFTAVPEVVDAALHRLCETP